MLLSQELRRRTYKDLLGGGEDEEETNAKERNIDAEERKMAEERNIDNEDKKIAEERDTAVLCRNVHCLGSLLQSWVVESFLEVGIDLIFFRKDFILSLLRICCITRWQRQSRCVIITSIRGAAHMKRL